MSANTIKELCPETILIICVASGIWIDPPSLAIRSLIEGSLGSASWWQDPILSSPVITDVKNIYPE